MGEPAFDTLNIAKELERDFGFEQKQAEGAAMMIHRHLVGNVATKEDIAALDKKLTGEITRVEEKLTGQITRVEEKLSGEIKWIKLIGGAILGVLILPWLAELARGILP